MIVLNTGTTNRVALTLTENTTITGASYIFNFYDDFSNKYFTATDISAQTGRTNVFDLTLVSTDAEENLTGGTINFNYNQKEYKIYQTYISGSYDINDKVDYSTTREYIGIGKI